MPIPAYQSSTESERSLNPSSTHPQQDTTEVSTGLDVVGQFQLHDLILLEAATASLAMPSVGVVIKLEKDALQVYMRLEFRGVKPTVLTTVGRPGFLV